MESGSTPSMAGLSRTRYLNPTGGTNSGFSSDVTFVTSEPSSGVVFTTSGTSGVVGFTIGLGYVSSLKALNVLQIY